MANNLRRIILLVANLTLLSETSLALENYKEYQRDRWDFEVATQYFYSQANYTNFGEGTQSLLSGNYYALWDTQLVSRYMPRQDWSVFGWGTVGYSESKDSLAKRSNSSITEIAGGVDFLMYDGAFKLIPEFVFIVPLEDVDPRSDKVLNAEGVVQFNSRLIGQMNFNAILGYGWIGFNYRGDGRSYLMPWGVGGRFSLAKKVQLGAELFGYHSITDDNEDTALRTSYINGANAGSMRFYSRNPSLVDSQAYLNWQLNPKWMLQANGGTTIAGANMAAGFHLGAFIRYSFDMAAGYTRESDFDRIDSPVPNSRSRLHEDDSEISSEKKVPKFREEINDGVDQEIFKPEPTKKPERPRIKDTRPRLDEDDFQVELKAEKKKKRRK